MYVLMNGYMLAEMTAAEYRKADPAKVDMVTAYQAHRHVKRGGVHSTPLYIDGTGRVRRAQDQEN